MGGYIKIISHFKIKVIFQLKGKPQPNIDLNSARRNLNIICIDTLKTQEQEQVVRMGYQ